MERARGEKGGGGGEIGQIEEDRRPIYICIYIYIYIYIYVYIYI